MSAAWERVLAELEHGAAELERACTDAAAEARVPPALPRDLGPLPAALAARAGAVLGRLRDAERAVDAARRRVQRALVIADAGSPAAPPRFIDTRS